MSLYTGTPILGYKSVTHSGVETFMERTLGFWFLYRHEAFPTTRLIIGLSARLGTFRVFLCISILGDEFSDGAMPTYDGL